MMLPVLNQFFKNGQKQERALLINDITSSKSPALTLTLNPKKLAHLLVIQSTTSFLSLSVFTAPSSAPNQGDRFEFIAPSLWDSWPQNGLLFVCQFFQTLMRFGSYAHPTASPSFTKATYPRRRLCGTYGSRPQKGVSVFHLYFPEFSLSNQYLGSG